MVTRARQVALLTCFLAFAAPAIPRPAAAYVLPSEAILSSCARRRAQLAFRNLILEGSRRVGKAGDRPDETVYEVIRPGVGHREEWKGPDGVTVTLTLGQKRWRWKEGEHGPAQERARADVITTFLSNVDDDPGARRGMSLLQAYGIDDNQVSLSRLGHSVAYVIGAKPWDSTKPQLWIDKNLRLPVRLIEVDAKTKAVTDTRFLDYSSGQTGEWYPRRIEIWRDNTLVESTTYTNARVNEPLDERLFKPPT
jgi:hypothetical protein